MSHHPAKPIEPRQKCNGRPCYPNKHVAESQASAAESEIGKLATFKCKQCGMWHLKFLPT